MSREGPPDLARAVALFDTLWPLEKETSMRRYRRFLIAPLACLLAASSAAHAQSGRPLTIYVVDVEGGNATLFVGPSGQSLLIDTGNGGPAAQRDGDRILAAAK